MHRNITYINAGAGSGKTYTLTKILVGLIRDGGIEPERVILTTFTVKAASEFRERVKKALYQEGLFEEASRLDSALIGTVHSVCQRLITKYWFNLGLPPEMGVISEDSARVYLSQSLAELPTKAELKELHDFARFFDISSTEIGRASTLDFDYWHQELNRIIEFSTSYEIPDYAESRRKSKEFLLTLIDPAINYEISSDEFRDMLKEATDSVNFNNRIRDKKKYLDSFRELERRERRRNASWYRDVSEVFKPTYGPTCRRVALRGADVYRSEMVGDMVGRHIDLLFDLASRWRDRYAEFKRIKNVLDYNDMEKYMRTLLLNEETAAEIGREFHYLFVDEYQDSSPIQVKIFRDLSRLMRHSYWVGDYKQAIYGFRGSDVELVKREVDMIENSPSCSTETLSDSYRSLPDLVELANRVFTQTFSGMLSPDKIRLTPTRTNDNGEISLRYFLTEGKKSEIASGIALHLMGLLREGAKPDEICVLARSNSELADIAIALKDNFNIPSGRDDLPVADTPEWLLVKSLLLIVDNKADKLAKATVAYLVEPDYTLKKIIEEKIISDNDDLPGDSYLNSVPTVRRLLDVRGDLEHQSIATLVESMVIEMNLFSLIKLIDQADPTGGNLQVIVKAGKEYEQHCLQMSMPATISGFISYFSSLNPCGLGNPDGVRLATYHSSKGLQWRYVILTSLNQEPGNADDLIVKDIYGVHFDRSRQSDGDSSIFIRVLPWLFGKKKKPVASVGAILTQLPEFARIRQARIEEENRLLYVGLTRARDVILFNIRSGYRSGNLLQWWRDIGLPGVADISSKGPKWDILGVGMPFSSFIVSESDVSEWLETNPSADSAGRFALPRKNVNTAPRSLKYISPSMLDSVCRVNLRHDFGCRIPLGGYSGEMTVPGTCIHNIYASFGESRADAKEVVDRIIDGFDLSSVFYDRDFIVRAWEALCNWLRTEYGASVAEYHERPFRFWDGGARMIGSIDFVWQTPACNVLIDFKTSPLGQTRLSDPDDEHYAGRYGGQLMAYKRALSAADPRRVVCLLYYPVAGLIYELE